MTTREERFETACTELFEAGADVETLTELVEDVWCAYKLRTLDEELEEEDS